MEDLRSQSTGTAAGRHGSSITDSGAATRRGALFTLRSSKKLLSVNSVNDGFQGKKSCFSHTGNRRVVSAHSGRDGCRLFPELLRHGKARRSVIFPPFESTWLLHASASCSSRRGAPQRGSGKWNNPRQQSYFRILRFLQNGSDAEPLRITEMWLYNSSWVALDSGSRDTLRFRQ